MKLKELINYLNERAPLSLQENYDNAGLICGNSDQEIKGVLIALDCLEIIVDEAIAKNCNVIVCHHPIVFKGLKKITGRNYVERVIIKAIKNDIAIYASHTNLDHMPDGVNAVIMEKLGIKKYKILEPKMDLIQKLVVYVPNDHLADLEKTLFQAGAGNIGNYSECSFISTGLGSYKANELANPTLGSIGTRHQEPETKLEVIFPSWKQAQIVNAMITSHPYEEVAFDLLQLANTHQNIGSGMIGELESPVPILDFLTDLKLKMNAKVVRYTSPVKEKINRVAVCGGSGSFLINSAIREKADVFVTADIKYHEFFDADFKLVLADIGHFETEQFTIELLGAWIKKKFNTFAIHFTENSTNPINYL